MTAISKNVYIEKICNIVDRYSNTYHIKIKLKPTDIKASTYSYNDVVKMVKILHLKFVIYQYQSVRILT